MVFLVSHRQFFFYPSVFVKINVCSMPTCVYKANVHTKVKFYDFDKIKRELRHWKQYMNGVDSAWRWAWVTGGYELFIAWQAARPPNDAAVSLECNLSAPSFYLFNRNGMDSIVVWMNCFGMERTGYWKSFELCQTVYM